MAYHRLSVFEEDSYNYYNLSYYREDNTIHSAALELYIMYAFLQRERFQLKALIGGNYTIPFTQTFTQYDFSNATLTESDSKLAINGKSGYLRGNMIGLRSEYRIGKRITLSTSIILDYRETPDRLITADNLVLKNSSSKYKLELNTPVGIGIRL